MNVAAARRWDRRLLLLFGVALAVRAVYLWQYRHSPLFGHYAVDHAYYRDWALRIAAGDWLGEAAFDKGPLYPYLLGLVYSLIGPQDGCVLAGQMLLGATVPVWLFLGAQRLFGDNVALVAGLCSAVYGPLLYYECMITKTFLLPLLLVILLYAGLRYGEKLRARWLGLAGIATGLMCLVQENHLLLWLPAAVWTWQAGGAAGQPCRHRLGGLLVLSLATVLPLVPCAVRNYAVTGELVVVTAGGGEVFYIAHGPDAEAVYSPPTFVTADAAQEHRDFLAEAQRRLGRPLTRQQASQYWFGEAWRYAVAHPRRELALTVRKALVLFQDFEVPDSASFAETRRYVPLLYVLPTFGWFVALGFVGVLTAGRSMRQRRGAEQGESRSGRAGHSAAEDRPGGAGQPAGPDARRLWLPLGMAGVLVLSVLLTYNFGRFRIALAPLWMLFAAQGAAWIVSAWRRRAEPTTALAFVAAVLCVLVVTGFVFLPVSGGDYRVSQALREGVNACTAGDFVHAEKQFREALELGRGSGDEPAIHNNLGIALVRQGRLAEAAEHFAEALRMNPDYRDAAENLVRVQADLRAARQKTPGNIPAAQDASRKDR